MSPTQRVVTIAALTWALDRLARGEKVALASIIEAKGSVPGKPGARLVISSNGGTFGTVGGAGLEKKVENRLKELLFEEDRSRKRGGVVEVFLLHKDGKGKEVTALDSLCGGQVTIAMEVMEPRPHILIAGGGHVGYSLGIVSDTLGWSHSVFDVRREYSNEERFPYAEELISSPVSDFISSESEESIMRFSDIILLGHDWAIDEELLIGILKLRADEEKPRIGVIGSKSKWKAFKKSAIGSGIEEGWIDSVRCPIGLEIGAETPEEIAVAVCAELLCIDRGSSLSKV